MEIEMKRENLGEMVGQKALRAILYEVSATPKPGLIDRNNSGAHQDMNFYTFMDSAAALKDVFDRFTQIGEETRECSCREARVALQSYGLAAEREMFAVTKGINTHKGIIFSFGFLCGAIGRMGNQAEFTPEEIVSGAAALCQGLCEEVYNGSIIDKKELTKGEAVYLRYGVKGARAEAEGGFPAVLEVGLPAFVKMRQAGKDINEASIYALLELMAHTGDTNVLSRHDMKTAIAVKEKADHLATQMQKTGVVDLRAVKQLDQEFIEGNISPGGAADLLAVTIFLYLMCYEE